MKALLVHPGTQHSFTLAAQLARHGFLGRFWTGLAYVPSSWSGRLVCCMPRHLQKALSNRRLEGVIASRVRTRPLIEFRALCRRRAGCDEQQMLFERNQVFQRSLPLRELENNDVVIGFDTSSWLLAEQALGLGRQFLLDQSNGHPLSYQRIGPYLRRRFPEWNQDLPARLPDFLAAEATEHRLATRIIVASSFARKTLIDNGIPPERIVVIPYGVDLTAFAPRPNCETSRPLRFIFIGSIGVRKGVPTLLQAWHSFIRHDAELWLVGPLTERIARLIPPLPGLRVIGKVPHCELPALMRQCDVFVFPSYFEGFGLVLLEALAAGLPVIASDATAAPDLIREGVQGHIVPAGDAEALREAIRHFIDHPDDLPRMSQAARCCAEGYSWEAYGDRWAELLHEIALCKRAEPLQPLPSTAL